ncbi:hypothetical protein DMC30DRAFT_97074 [Rhodotorula diobovata]|uniref:Uncharacterized protein n=1 Tax=Rhodotorula diobovata TaxID=5288 RepID=A0A5C5FP18_9BASI|nr:hypothetical protein DMC30DRAFT_97074 [Rhodotorula diobovata]
MSRYDYWRVSHIHSPETKLSRLRAWLAQWYPERAQVLGFFLERWSELLPNERQHLVDDALTAFCESLTGNLDSTPTTFDAECRHIGFYNHASSQADLMGPKAGAVEVSRVAQVHAAVDKLRQVCVTGSRSAKRVQATSFGWWRKVLLEGTSGVTRSKLYRMDARIFEQLLAELTDLATSDIPNRLKPGFNVKDLLPSPDELLENAFNQATTPTNRYQSFVGFVEDAWHLCAAQLNEARKAVTRLESTGPGNPKLHEHAQHVATAQHDLGQREAHLNDVNRALASLKEPLSLQLFDELGKARQVWVVNKAREVVYQQCATFESTGRWHVPENLVCLSLF